MDTGLCVFIKDGVIVLCYVDDLFLFTKQKAYIEDIQRNLKSRCLVKALSKPKRFLGLDTNWNPDGSLSLR